jgi:hypothetical protein
MDVLIPAANGWASFAAKPGDRVLFERGGVFKRQDRGTFLGGVQYGAYGDPAKPLPEIVFGNGAYVEVDGTNDATRASNISVRDIYFNFTQTKSKYGLHFVNFTNVNVARVRINGVCGTGLSAEPFGAGRRCSGFTLTNSVIENSYPADSTTHSQGLFLAGTDGWTIVGNVFDRNGYKPGVINGTAYNQNAYIHGSNGGGGKFNFNVSARASSHGVQLRAGGEAVGNLFFNNAAAMSYGLVNGEACFAGGVTGVVKNNVIIGGNQLPGQIKLGWGIQVSNAKQVLFDTNLLYANAVPDGIAFETANCQNLKNPAQVLDPSHWNLTLKRTYIWNWQGTGYKPSAGNPVLIDTPTRPLLLPNPPTVDLEAIKQRVLVGYPDSKVDDGSGGTIDLSTVLSITTVTGLLPVENVKQIKLRGKLVPDPAQPPLPMNPSVQPFFDAAHVIQAA